MHDVLAIILAGGEGSRLHPLTRDRAKPAVVFGGIYRIIDFTLSNCVNSGVRRIQMYTQYKSLSLQRHIRLGWDSIMCGEFGEYIEIIPPQKRVSDHWYLGTADAVYQNLYSIERERPAHVLVLSGDHIYKMDYQKFREFHIEKEADVTLATTEVDASEAHRFGVLGVDSSYRIGMFHEKPKKPPTIPGKPHKAMINMGVYIFSPDVLREVLADDAESNSSHDFGRDILPRIIKTHKVLAYHFPDHDANHGSYWRDIGTIDAYWEANMDLVSVSPVFNLYEKAWPIRTYQGQYPPAKFVFAQEGRRFGVAVDSIVASGCIVSGGRVVNSILSNEVRINSFSHVEQSILMTGVDIGRYCKIRRAIIERDVKVPPRTVIGFNLEEDARRFHVTDSGIVVVERGDEFRPLSEPMEEQAPSEVPASLNAALRDTGSLPST